MIALKTIPEGIGKHIVCIYAHRTAETYAALKKAIEKRGYSVDQYDDTAMTAHIKTGVSAFSWGEKITVTVQASPKGGSEVLLHSAPKLGANVVDMGRGKRQLEQIAALLKEEPEGEAAPAAAAPAAVPAAPAPSLAEEIRQLAQLRDEGILTDEEFTAKEKQLLGI